MMHIILCSISITFWEEMYVLRINKTSKNRKFKLKKWEDSIPIYFDHRSILYLTS